MQEILDGGEVNPQLAEYHLCHFMSHVLHFIRVVQNAGNYDIQQALTQICIGSDFDGLINPVRCCMTVMEINTLKNSFRDNFMFYVRENRELVTLPPGFDIDRFTEQLFFENGKNFILNRL